jgi:hypothetical protein
MKTFLADAAEPAVELDPAERAMCDLHALDVEQWVVDLSAEHDALKCRVAELENLVTLAAIAMLLAYGVTIGVVCERTGTTLNGYGIAAVCAAPIAPFLVWWWINHNQGLYPNREERERIAKERAWRVKERAERREEAEARWSVARRVVSEAARESNIAARQARLDAMSPEERAKHSGEATSLYYDRQARHSERTPS